jgi:CHAT domain-containing protein
MRKDKWNRPVLLSRLVELKMDTAFLAFLSACETAKGDQDQPDQIMHLAAAMMFTGFKSVIATMWYAGIYYITDEFH